MAEMFKLSIVTPDGEFYNEPVEKIVISTTEGDLGVFFDHTPTTVTLSTGPCVIFKNGKEIRGVVHGGFAEILEDRVILLPDAAEWPSEIDLSRAKHAKERAEKLLAEAHQLDEVKLLDTKAAHARAITRIDVAEWVDKD
jgi:F-type H+-transporting ATPase subunit epsilon